MKPSVKQLAVTSLLAAVVVAAACKPRRVDASSPSESVIAKLEGGDITVTRIRDDQAGAVCYVATSKFSQGGLAIQCMRKGELVLP